LVHRVLKYLHSKIAEACGPDWHKKNQDNLLVPVEYDIYDIGPLLGYIQKFLRGCPLKIRVAAEAWKKLRDTVAHNDVLDFEQLHDAMDKLKQI
jgi:hypothetical protein